MTTNEFEAAVMEHKDRVHNYAHGILRDPEDAKDVAQECLIRLWRNREQIEPGAGCRSWLLRAAHNLCIDRIRRRSKHLEAVRVEGLAYEEIALLLDLKMGTLKATLHRAREKLRHALVRAEVTP